MHKLTIAVLTYNRANYLKKMLDSILLQTYRNFFVIIYDNCSEDNTSDTVKPFLSDSRFSYHRHITSIGRENGNYALKNCTTDYLLIVHDDDIMHPDMVKEEIAILDSDENVSIVSTNINHINTNDEIIKTSVLSSMIKNKDLIINSRNYIMILTKIGNIIMCPTVMFRMQIIKDNHLFFKSFIGGPNDVFMWLELNQLNNKFYCINKALYNYRIHNTQESQQSLLLIPLLKKPVYELLLAHNYSKRVINLWLRYSDICILSEINKLKDKKNAFNTIKKYVLFLNNKDMFLFAGLYYLFYMPLFIQNIVFLPLRIFKRIFIQLK